MGIMNASSCSRIPFWGEGRICWDFFPWHEGEKNQRNTGLRANQLVRSQNAMSQGKKVAIDFQSYDLTRIANVRVPDMLASNLSMSEQTSKTSKFDPYILF
ncbi:hypothetical protein M9H77_18929 [Catharanthus roseus]|uniref:Uncharacterized protein n=1 Tax=Catharanthus roseus TaxID=4058 RepID=A0ACC0B8T6_CATRO|nr:hypothetical protein M9H77_18929 [Catharanthus roseus]